MDDLLECSENCFCLYSEMNRLDTLEIGVYAGEDCERRCSDVFNQIVEVAITNKYLQADESCARFVT